MDKKIKNNYHQIRKSDKSKFYHHSMNFSASYFSTPGVLQGHPLIIMNGMNLWIEKVFMKNCHQPLPY